ncbi:hypothetical protein BGX30_001543 [Mortierella sp. GBA39]|nr:hypothetical protein BGX30_001543 [Mortierella sp. GBA39]
MASPLHPAASTSRSKKQHVKTQAHPRPSTTTIIHTFLFQLCFLICTTLLTLTAPTHAYPLLALSGDSPSSDSTNTLLTEADASNTPSVGANSTMEDTYGRLILDVGQRTVISTSNWVLGTILIIVGLVQVFYGFKFIRLTLVLTGFISWAVVAIMVTVVLHWDLVYLLFKPSQPYFWIWFMAGILGAILSFRYWDLGVAFSGGFGGFALAMGIIAAVNSSHNMTNTGRYILLAVLILFGAAIAIFYERFSIILGTSLGGAFMVMFGVDEFLQAGYREMIVIFDFAGKTLQYHPDKTVFIMIGCSLALACLGIAWEFWHHAKPLLVDRRALFRIYGRPFGKRPHKLAGQRLKRRVATSDWYSYLAGCLCLKRRTAEEVLYGDDESYDEAANAAAAAAAAVAAGTTIATTGQVDGEDEKTGFTTSDGGMETIVIVVDETHSLEKITILPGSEIIYGSGIESPIHGISSSSSSSHSTLTTQTATGTGTGPVEVVVTETSESVDENGARIVTTTTTTTATSSGSEQHEQHYSSTESRTQNSESMSSHLHQMTSESNSSHSEMMRTESSVISSSSQSAHMATTTTTVAAARSIKTSNTSTSKTLLQSMTAAHHSSSSRTTTTTTTDGSGTTTVVASHSSSSP